MHGLRYYAEAADQGPGHLPGRCRRPSARRTGIVDPPPDRRLRGDHAVQLPAHAARHQGRARARDAATPWSPSRRPRRRSPRSRSRSCSPRLASPTACSTSSPAAARRSATRSSAIPTCAASRSPARPTSAATSLRSPPPQLKRLTLELGGSDPVIVCEDADVDAAVKAVIIGRYWNAGQACLGCKRVFVHDSRLRRLRRRSSSSASSATSPATARSRPRSRSCGWARSTPSAGRDELLAQLEDGVAHGGELLIGGGTGGQRQGLVPRAGGRRRARRGLAAHDRGGVRPGAAGVPLHRLRRRDRARQRHAVRPRLVDLDARRRARSTAPRRRSTPA